VRIKCTFYKRKDDNMMDIYDKIKEEEKYYDCLLLEKSRLEKMRDEIDLQILSLKSSIPIQREHLDWLKSRRTE